MRWLRDPYRPLGTSYWGYRARYAVLVHLALIAPVVGGLAWTLRLALPGAAVASQLAEVVYALPRS